MLRMQDGERFCIGSAGRLVQLVLLDILKAVDAQAGSSLESDIGSKCKVSEARGWLVSFLRTR